MNDIQAATEAAGMFFSLIFKIFIKHAFEMLS